LVLRRLETVCSLPWSHLGLETWCLGLSFGLEGYCPGLGLALTVLLPSLLEPSHTDA